MNVAASLTMHSEFEQGIMMQMVQVHRLFPSGRSSFRAREALVGEFYRYFNQAFSAPVHPSMSMVKALYEHNRAQGLSTEDLARAEVGQMAASVSNTIPAAFWMLWHILSDPVILAECRDEIERLADIQPRTQTHDGRSVSSLVCILDTSKLSDRAFCPILVSTWREVLRYHHVGIAARVVMEDTFLDQYFLKKDSTIMVVNPVMHTDVSIWGPSAHEFHHHRFLEKEIPSTKSEKAAKSRGECTSALKWSEHPENSPACRNFGG